MVSWLINVCFVLMRHTAGVPWSRFAEVVKQFSVTLTTKISRVVIDADY